MNFRVGQKVVCVDDVAHKGFWVGAEAPTGGRVYTVRRVFINKFSRLSLLLCEIDRSPYSVRFFGENTGYGASRFRPLVEKKTDAGMAILKTILDEVNAGKHREIVDA